MGEKTQMKKINDQMKNRFMVIINRKKIGLFSNFIHTLQYLHSSELEDRIPVIHWAGGIYSEDRGYRGVERNIWEYYFKKVSNYSLDDTKGHDIVKGKTYRNKSLSSEPKYCWDWIKMYPEICLNNPSKEGRIFINGLIEKYIVIREEIQKKIDDFYDSNMVGGKTLGVHLRLCNDHRNSEIKNVLKKSKRYVREYVDRNPEAKIFLSTDVEKGVEIMRKEFGDRVVYTNSKRSVDGNPVQYGCKPKKQYNSIGALAGEEVIIDCKLLSLCDELYHGESNVSAAALCFNPHMKNKYIYV